VAAFRVKLGANDLHCVDVPLNPTHSLYRLGVAADWHKLMIRWCVMLLSIASASKQLGIWQGSEKPVCF